LGGAAGGGVPVCPVCVVCSPHTPGGDGPAPRWQPRTARLPRRPRRACIRVPQGGTPAGMLAAKNPATVTWLQQGTGRTWLLRRKGKPLRGVLPHTLALTGCMWDPPARANMMSVSRVVVCGRDRNCAHAHLRKCASRLTWCCLLEAAVCWQLGSSTRGCHLAWLVP